MTSLSLPGQHHGQQTRLQTRQGLDSVWKWQKQAETCFGVGAGSTPIPLAGRLVARGHFLLRTCVCIGRKGASGM